MQVSRSPSIAALHDHRRERFVTLANMCRFGLIEARRLVLVGTSPSPLAKLIATVEGLLDDLDELLFAFDPIRHPEEFAQAADLHIALDELAILRKEAATMRPPEKALSTHDRLRPGTF